MSTTDIIAVIGLITSIIFGIVSVYLARKTLHRKSICYEILARTPLITVNQEAEGRIQILFDRTSIQDLYLVAIRVSNNGNMAIKPEDFRTPLYVQFGRDARILSCAIRARQPDGLHVAYTMKQISHVNTLVFNKMLLNAKDNFTIKVLVTNYNGELTVGGRIVDIEKIQCKGHSRGNAIAARPLQ